MNTCLHMVVDRGLNELSTAKECTVIVKKANPCITNSSSEGRSSGAYFGLSLLKLAVGQLTAL